MALREINLIPSDLSAMPLLKRHIIFWSSYLLLAVGIVLALGFVHKYAVGAKKQTLSAMREIPAQLVNRMALLKDLQRDQDWLNERRSVFSALRAKSVPPSPILFKVSELMNDQTWLTQFALDTEEGQTKATHLRLAGFSTSSDQLGDFINRLSSERLFKDVVLKMASEARAEEQAAKNGTAKSRISFEITCDVKRDK